MNRFEQLGSRQVADVAMPLGLTRFDRTHLGPCPACGEKRRSRTDSRSGPIYTLHGGRGWKCDACKVAGTTVQMVAWLVVGRVPAKGDPGWRQVLEVAARHGWCDPLDEAAGSAPAPRPRPAPPPVEPVQLGRPDPRELAEVWGSALPVVEDDEVATWLRSRGLDPEVVAELDLARALRPGRHPRWARMMGHGWAEGWRCLFPAYGATGVMESLRARWVKPFDPPPKCEKACGTATGPGSASRLALADGVGRQVLQAGAAPPWWPAERPLEVVIVEGEPDLLTWATRPPSADPVAVLGVWSGSWCDELAARIPDCSRVHVRVHCDPAGERYANTITRSLWVRCGVLRVRGDHHAAA